MANLANGFSNCTDQQTAAQSDPVQLPESGTWYLETAFVHESTFGDRPGSATILLR
ncbi:MAG TPA: hypothetical protein VMM13_08270 [Euzebya sp.]|nr:hypothetical protein [Euzebya sp.]